jgi:hypothetical protein
MIVETTSMNVNEIARSAMLARADGFMIHCEADRGLSQLIRRPRHGT